MSIIVINNIIPITTLVNIITISDITFTIASTIARSHRLNF